MSSPTTRRPLPAMVLLIALTLLTSLVWWRVLHRDGGHAAAGVKCVKPKSSESLLPRPASVNVSVLNSTTRAGLARTTATSLTKLGFKVAGFGNDLPKVLVAGVAEIRFGPAQEKDAALLSYYFPGAKLVPLKSDPHEIVVVSLGKKFTGVATGRTATAHMSAAHVSLAPASSAAALPSPSASC